MPLISKPNYNQIFASQAPDQDKPAVFNNYPEGWGPESRPNNGKPTIKGFNYLHQTSDLKDLWILQNGACLPYDESIEYADGAPVLKDGVIQYKTADGFSPAISEKPYTLNYFTEGAIYPLNARVMLENGDIVKSTIDGNTVNPNVDMTGWDVQPTRRELDILNDQLLTTDQFPRWPGELDDTPRLQRALDESALRQQTLYMVGDFSASAPLYVSHNIQGSDSIITYPLDYNELGLVVSAEKSASHSTRLYRKRLWLPSVITSKSSSGNNWSSNAGSVGIKLINLMECKVWLKETYFWEIDVHIAAIGTDANYNEFYFGTHTFAKKCLYIEIDGTASKASCNQNRYISGRFAVNNTATRTAGVYLIHAEIKGDNASSFNNSDLSTNSVEGSGDEVAIYIQNSGNATNGASYNTINGARLETGNVAGKKIVFDGANVRWNDVNGGYGILVDNIEYRNGAGQTSLLTTAGNISLNGNAGGGTRPLLSLKHAGGVNSPTAMGFATSVADADTNNETYASWVFGGQTFAVGVAGQAYKRFNITYSSGAMRWGSGAADFDTVLTRLNGQGLKLDRKFIATQGIGVGNAQDATTIPASGLVKKIQIFDENGASLGFIPVYSVIT